MPEGIDVYTRYQDVRDWDAVRRAGYSFCYVKVSDGTSDRPDNGYGFAGRAAGLAMGAYHYAQFGDPVAQANRLVDRAEATGLTDLAPALDLEDPFTPDRAATDFAVAFVRQVRARGHRPCLYGSNSMLAVVRAPVLAAAPDAVIWVARYGAGPTVPYDVWQWSSSGTTPGISGSVDLNRGDVPLNTATGGHDDMELATTYTDWAGNQQSVQSTLNNLDKRLAEVHAALLDWQPSRIPGDANKTRMLDAVLDTVADVRDPRHGLVALRDAVADPGEVDVDALAAALTSTLSMDIVRELGRKLVGE